MDFLKNNRDIFFTSGITLGIGFLGKSLFNEEIVNVSDPKKIIEEFVFVSFSGFLAKEIIRKKETGLIPCIPSLSKAKKLTPAFTKDPDLKPVYPRLDMKNRYTKLHDGP